jgi:hypothetical protein
MTDQLSTTLSSISNSRIESTAVRLDSVDRGEYKTIAEYIVKSDGQVYRIISPQIHERVETWLDIEGRTWVILFHDGELDCVPLNRLVCASFRGQPRSNECGKVAHINGRRSDCSVSNLIWTDAAYIRRLPRIQNSTPFQPTLLSESQLPRICQRFGLPSKKTITLQRGWLAGCEVEFFRFPESLAAGFSYGTAEGFMRILSFRPSMLIDARPRNGYTLTLQRP